MNWKINNNSKYKDILDKAKNEKRANIHSLHRYYGKLIPAIPNAFIKSFTQEGDIIGDLFSGSGTVAVEAKRLNRNFIGTEINPLSHLISEVKTKTLDIEVLNKCNILIEEMLNDSNLNSLISIDSVPYCINIDHWFKKEVQEDLMLIKGVIEKVVIDKSIVKNNKEDYLKFYYITMSAIVRNVSNADPAHVFPGFSKRMRKAEAEGKNIKNAKKTFINAIKKRAKYYDEYYNNKENSDITIINGDATNIELNNYKNKVSLFVTNPPYISSVRYIETMKLEMYWLEFIKNSEEYGALSKLMLGNDRVSKKEISDDKLERLQYNEINKTISIIKEKSEKDAYIVQKYFLDMEKVIRNMNFMLKKDGIVVMKISDSNVKKIKVETGNFLSLIAEKNGFKLDAVFLDKIEKRSLTTARNTYSDIILNDHIIIWRKVGDICV